MRRLTAPLALAFALAVTGGVRGAVLDEIVVKVNDSVVTRSEYERRIQSTSEGMKREYKGPDLEERLKELPQRLLEQMVEELLLVERAKQLYQIEELVNYQVEAFMQENKIPDKEALAQALQNEGMTMEEFRKQILQVYVPEFVKSREIRSKVSLSTDEIATYYEAHKGDLASQLQVNLQEIFLPRPQVGEEQAQAAAEQIAREYASGRDFGELAATYSQAYSRSNRGEAGWFSRTDLSADLAEAIFKTPAGGITPLLTTPAGYYIFRVAEVKQPAVPTLEEARDTVVNRLREEKFAKEYRRFIDQLKAENYVRINPKYV